MIRRINLIFGSLLVIYLVSVLAFSASILSAYPAERFDRQDEDVLAQRGRNFQRQAEDRFNRMCQFLGLDEKQKEQARKLFDARREEMRKIMGDARDGNLSREQARGRMEESFETYLEKLEKLLTEEQKAKLEQWVKENPRRRGSRGRSGPGDNS